MSTRQPPIGVEPRVVWLEKRAIELTAAIERHIKGGQAGRKIVQDWTVELLGILEELEH